MQLSTAAVEARCREIFEQAAATGIDDPNAMVLSTVSTSGQPSSRVVLLKGFDERGFVFYTNLESRKAREIAANPAVSLSFYWRETTRQVTVLGKARPVEIAEADAYFASRPRESQIGAWSSQQSRELGSREELLAAVRAVEARFAGREVPRPPHWSGFVVEPTSIEFWQAGEFRLHHRECYVREGELWRGSLIYP